MQTQTSVLTVKKVHIMTKKVSKHAKAVILDMLHQKVRKYACNVRCKKKLHMLVGIKVHVLTPVLLDTAQIAIISV